MQDSALSGSIDRLSLQRALYPLADGDRIVFVLHDIEGMEHHEIAELLGCSAGTCKSCTKPAPSYGSFCVLTGAENSTPGRPVMATAHR